MKTIRLTEQPSTHGNLEKLSIHELLAGIHEEDRKVTEAIDACLPQIERLVEALVPRLQNGGRLFYLGAGTSGRLGVLDASEIPPTFGLSGTVVGIIAGGDAALRRAVEQAEDDPEQGWKDLQMHHITCQDTLVGIAASGCTPYVVGAVQEARRHGILTAGITSNPGAPLSQEADIPIEVTVGPEFVTGSSRMKSGTAQKMILNMISTCTMIRLGRVKGNRMVHLQLNNQKLIDRGTRILMEELHLPEEEARNVLREEGSVPKALERLANQPDSLSAPQDATTHCFTKTPNT